MDKKSQNIILLITIVIISIIASYFVTSFYFNSHYQTQISNLNQTHQTQISNLDQTYQTQLNSMQQQNLQFFKEYSVALNDIHIGSYYTDLANINSQKFNEYISSNGYVYAYAEPVANLGKEQATKSKDYLTKAKTKLAGIKDNAPNDFFKEDISNRIEQVDLLIIYATQAYNLLDYRKQELYEVNYGSQTKSTEYLNKYNALILEYNSNLKKLSEIQNKIDIKWDQDWYPTFQESV